MNEHVFKGKWKEMKGDIQRTWGKLTNDDIDRAQGNLKVLYGSVQQKYGSKYSEFENKMEELFKGIEKKIDKVAKDIRK